MSPGWPLGVPSPVPAGLPHPLPRGTTGGRRGLGGDAWAEQARGRVLLGRLAVLSKLPCRAKWSADAGGRTFSWGTCPQGSKCPPGGGGHCPVWSRSYQAQGPSAGHGGSGCEQWEAPECQDHLSTALGMSSEGGPTHWRRPFLKGQS